MISSIDHFVLTVASMEATLAFYERVLGMRREQLPGRPSSLLFGRQKINVHQIDRTFEPKALRPTAGSSDFCLITDQPLADVIGRLKSEGVTIEVGPVERNGARGPMTSVYFRDPDGNLVEVSRYHEAG